MLTGSNRGLIVIVNTSTEDYFYPNKNTLGYSISINSPTEYPDESSGNFNRIIVPTRTEAFVKLDVTTIEATEAVEMFSIEQVYFILKIFFIYKFFNYCNFFNFIEGMLF